MPFPTTRTTAEDRLIVVLGGLLPLLLVAAVTAAVALPRHGADAIAEVHPPLVGQLDAPALPAEPPAPPVSAPAPAPTVVTPPAVEHVADAEVGRVLDAEVASPLEDQPPVAEVGEADAPPPVDPAPEPSEQQAPPPAQQLHAAPAPVPPPTPAPSPQPGPEPTPEPTPEPAPEPSPEPQRQAESAAGADERSDSERIFAREFPAHDAARQTADPATRSWAVLVGVNRYAGRTADTLGSVADVLVLRDVLLRQGWREDHILVLTDGTATHDRIVRGLEWLIRSTDERSTVVFSFSGHIRHDAGRGVSALWPADNRYLWAEDFGRLMGAVPAGRLWASLQGCHSEGLRAPGLEGPGRVITYSSHVAEKSYEDPEVGHSVQGYYLFAEGLRDRWGDGDGDGRVSVQEAWRWAAPRAHKRTARLQTPVIADGAGGAFHLGIGADG